MPDTTLQFIESPPRTPGTPPPPLLVTFHGYGSHMGDLHGLRDLLDGRFHVCSPQAPIDLGPMGMPGGWAWFNLSFTPDEGIGYDADGALHAIEAAEHFVLEQKRRLGSTRVVLLGFSQGAMLAHALLLRNTIRPIGIAACSGRMVDDVFGDPSSHAGSLTDMPVFASHGRFDDVIPVQSGRDIQNWYGQTGARLDYREYDMAHGIDPSCLGDLAAWCSALLDQTSTR
ncbi:MAG: hypothetical protein MK074_10035 [Phycisphaerales bacterium]|nr:hypothetical protein [Phycisphaerales bacterium]